MNKQQSFKHPLVILILCVCLGSLALLPVTDSIGMHVLEVPEIDLDHTELEEDLFIVTMTATTITGLVTLKPGSMNLGFHPACLSPLSPPPKNS